MAQDIFIPKLGMTMKEGRIAQWKGETGDWIDQGEVVLVIETEKVAHEIEAEIGGFLIVLASPGDVIPCGEVVGKLAATQEEYDALCQDGASPATGDTAPEQDSAAPPADPVGTSDKPEPSVQTTGRIKISPAAKKRALEWALDISAITGTGPGGKIVIKDVEAARDAETAAPEVAAPVADAGVADADVVDGKRIKKRIPMAGMRKQIAHHMVHSLAVSAQVSLTAEIDMTEMIAFRSRLIEKQEQIGAKISYNDLFVMAVAKAINKVPLINASIVDDEILVWDNVNVGVAVSLEAGEYDSGLIVPVIKDADKKSLSTISKETRELITRSREGTLEMDDLSGGTVTISNVGSMAQGWTCSTPVLNQPQAIIIQPGAIMDRPVVVDGEIVIRPIMTLTITFDHRILDGAPVGKFFHIIKNYFQDPDLLTL